MQRRFRKLCQPPAAIVAMGCVLLAGAACTADADESPPQVTLPTPAPFEPSPSTTFPDALQPYVEFEDSLVEILRTGGASGTSEKSLKLTTPDGSARAYAQSVIDWVKRDGAREVTGTSSIMHFRSAATENNRIVFHVCWDNRDFALRDVETPDYAHMVATMAKQEDGSWLTHDLVTAEVEPCVEA